MDRIHDYEPSPREVQHFLSTLEEIASGMGLPMSLDVMEYEQEVYEDLSEGSLEPIEENLDRVVGTITELPLSIGNAQLLIPDETGKRYCRTREEREALTGEKATFLIQPLAWIRASMADETNSAHVSAVISVLDITPETGRSFTEISVHAQGRNDPITAEQQKRFLQEIGLSDKTQATRSDAGDHGDWQIAESHTDRPTLKSIEKSLRQLLEAPSQQT